MAALSRHRFAEGVLSVGSLGALVAALAAMDQTFHAQVMDVLRGEPSSKLALAGATLQRGAHLIMDTIGTYSGGHTSMVIFVFAAVGLFLLMLKS